MNDKDINSALLEFEVMYDALKAVVEGIPENEIVKRKHPDKWSPQEILQHMVDSALNDTVRMMKIIAEDGSDLMPYDQEKWAGTLFYAERDRRQSLLLFGLLRSSMLEILNRIPLDAWDRKGNHPERGVMTLADVLTDANDHMKSHLAQMIAQTAAPKIKKQRSKTRP